MGLSVGALGTKQRCRQAPALFSLSLPFLPNSPKDEVKPAGQRLPARHMKSFPVCPRCCFPQPFCAFIHFFLRARGVPPPPKPPDFFGSLQNSVKEKSLILCHNRLFFVEDQCDLCQVRFSAPKPATTTRLFLHKKCGSMGGVCTLRPKSSNFISTHIYT